MSEMLYGGAAYGLGYRLKYLASGDVGYPDYKIVQADGSTAATTTAHASIILDGYIEESNYAPDSAGKIKATIGQYDVAEEIIDNLNMFAKKPATSAGAAPAGVLMEHGITQGGGTSTSRPKILWIGAGPLTSTKRLAFWFVAEVDMASGPIVFKQGSWIKPDFILNSVPAEYTLEVAEDLFPAALFGDVGALSVPQYEEYMREYLVKGPRT